MRDFQTEYGSQQVLASGLNGFTSVSDFKNLNCIIIAHLNISSTRNKSEPLAYKVIGNVDNFVISETKLDASFPIEQFKIPGFSTPFRRDRDRYSGAFLVFVREDIPAKHLSSESTPTGGIYIELNFRRKNWLLCSTYNPNRNIVTNHLDVL